jgi:hypothetical protein
MKSDYLWDGSGEPDAELERIEKALGQFRTRADAASFQALQRGLDAHRSQGVLGSWRWPRLLAASLVAAGAAAAVAGLFLGGPWVSALPGWDVARVEGAPVVGSSPLQAGRGREQLRVGEMLVTDNRSRASLQVADIGELMVDPGSRLRLLETGSRRKRIAVELGTIHAAIWAPPGEFVVDTPSATAVDLGCAYSLTVAEDGSGTLRTKLGWVGFHENGHDSFIPAGAMCLTRPKEGPGTPYFEDSSERLRQALHALDFTQLDQSARKEALRTVLAEARRRDAFTLWHLLGRVKEEERPMVYDRLVQLVKAPGGTTRERTLQLDRTTLDRWWNAFDLGDIGVWRYWEQQEAPRTKRAAS